MWLMLSSLVECKSDMTLGSCLANCTVYVPWQQKRGSGIPMMLTGLKTIINILNI